MSRPACTAQRNIILRFERIIIPIGEEEGKTEAEVFILGHFDQGFIVDFTVVRR
jgi:hypothetical protein